MQALARTCTNSTGPGQDLNKFYRSWQGPLQILQVLARTCGNSTGPGQDLYKFHRSWPEPVQFLQVLARTGNSKKRRRPQFKIKNTRVCMNSQKIQISTSPVPPSRMRECTWAGPSRNHKVNPRVFFRDLISYQKLLRGSPNPFPFARTLGAATIK